VQPAGHQRNAAGPADQQDPGQRTGRQLGPVQHPPGLVDRTVDQWPGDPLQLLPGQVDRVVGARHLHRRGRGPRQHLLGRLDLGPERAPVPLFGRRARVHQPLPRLRLAQRDELAEVPDEGRVDVDPAEVVQAADGQHPQPVRVAPHHGDVQRAAAEVEHEQAAAGRDRRAEHLGAVGRGRDRLVEQPHLGQPGRAGGGAQHVAPLRTPVCRAGQGDRAGQPFRGRLGDHPAQQRGEQLHDRGRAVAEQYRAVVDAPFRVRLEAAGIQLGQPFGVAAHGERAVRVAVHAGGQQRRTVEEQRPGRLTVPPDNSDGVAGAQIDDELIHHRGPPSRTRRTRAA